MTTATDIDDSYPSLPRVVMLLILTLVLAGLVSLLVDVLPGKSAIALSELVLILPTAYFLSRDGYSLRRVYRLQPVTPAVLGSAAVAGLGLTVWTDWLDRTIQPWVRNLLPMPEGLEHMLEELLRAQSPVEWISILVGAVILAGLFEEMIFRGMLQGAIENRIGGAVAIAVAAVVFALFHLNPWWFVQIAVLGGVFGLATWRSGSIYPSALMHAVNNFVSILFVNLPETALGWYHDGTQIRPAILLVALVLILFGGWQFWQFTRRPQKTVEAYPTSELGDRL